MERSQKTFEIKTTAGQYLNCGKHLRPANSQIQGSEEWHRFEASAQAMHNQIEKHGDWPDKEIFLNEEIAFTEIQESGKELHLKDNVAKLENLYYKEVTFNTTVAIYQG